MTFARRPDPYLMMGALRLVESTGETAAAQLLRNQPGSKLSVSKVLFAMPQKVKLKKIRSSESAPLQETVRLSFQPTLLIEADSFDESKRIAKVFIIQDGQGNNGDNHYYFPDTIEQAVKDKVFDGAQAYVDHPSLDEDVNRPERSLRDLIGYYKNSKLVMAPDRNGVKRKTYAADLQIFEGKHYDWVVSLIKECIKYNKIFPEQTLAGISINADGSTSREESPETGAPVNGVHLIRKAFSADMVTKPARGGAFLSLQESERASGRKIRLKETA